MTYDPEHCPICGKQLADTVVSIASHVYWTHAGMDDCPCGWCPNNDDTHTTRIERLMQHIQSCDDPEAHLQEAWLTLNATQ